MATKHSSTKHSSTKHSSAKHSSAKHLSTKHLSAKYSSTKHSTPEYLTPDHKIYLVHDFLPSKLEHNIIEKLESECIFGEFTINNKILCRTGCFQGDQYKDESVPWLRCPSIEHQEIHPWSKTLGAIRDQINSTYHANTNIGKLQKYDTGESTIKLHADKIIDLEENTPIFVIRFGAPRSCVLVNKINGMAIFIKIPHNSLLVIEYEANLLWKHGIVKDNINDSSYSIVYRNSVTRKYKDHIFGERTPFATMDELVEYMDDSSQKKYKNLWNRENHKKHIIKCFNVENKEIPTLDVYKSVIRYSPFLY